MFGENIALELKNTRAMSVVSETIADLYAIPGLDAAGHFDFSNPK